MIAAGEQLRIVNGEIPVVGTGLKLADEDSSGGLSVAELAGKDSWAIPFEEKAKILVRMEPSRLAPLLLFLQKTPAAKEYFTRLAEESFEKSAAVLMELHRKDTFFNEDGIPETKNRDPGRLYAELLPVLLAKTPPLNPTHSNVVDALEKGSEGREIAVYGFGEHHLLYTRPLPGVPTTLHHFATEILPYLVRRKGVLMIGVELLHSDAQTTELIERYLQDEKIDAIEKTLLFDLTGEGDEGMRALLDMGRQLRREGYPIQIRGVCHERFLVGYKEGVEETNRCSLALVEEARRKGMKAALYNGSAHNTTRGRLHFSYVDRLQKIGVQPNQFLEVDMAVPEYHVDFQTEEFAPFVWRAPQGGVLLAEQGPPNSYLLVFSGAALKGPAGDAEILRRIFGGPD